MLTKTILTIDGGGMYGVVPLEVCIAIEERMGKPLRDIFDLFVGTSTGTIICAGGFVMTKHRDSESAKVLSAEEIMKKYYDLGIEKIFSTEAKNEPIPIAELVFKLYDRPRYKKEYLESAIKSVLGSGRKLGSLNRLYDGFISISAYNLSQGNTHFFRSWKDSNVNLEDAVIASSSAPTYHAPHLVDGSYYTDGGVFATNPAVYALRDAYELCKLELEGWTEDTNFVVVSIGTGKKEPKIANEELEDSNKISDLWWVNKLPKVVFDGQDETMDETMDFLGINSDRLEYFRFDAELNTIEQKKADETDRALLNKARESMRNELDTSLNSKFNRAIDALKRSR